MMLHEIAPHRLDNQYRPQAPTAESYGLCYDNGTVLVRESVDGAFELPTFGELEMHNADASITIDAEELASARWFQREDIPIDADAPDGSLTHEMIRQFKNGNV